MTLRPDVPTFTGERVCPWSMNKRPDLMRDHLMRYAFALGYVAGKRVIDLGCGTGYGSYILYWTASRVMGIDIDRASLDFADRIFPGPRYTVLDLDDVDRLPVADVYVAFEILEHLERPERLIELMGRTPVLWSLPVNNESQYHKHQYCLTEAETFVPESHIWHQYSTGVIVPYGVEMSKIYQIRQVIGGRLE